MLDILKAFIADLARAEARPLLEPDDPRLAAAALMAHVVAVDGRIGAAEAERFRHLLADRFDLDAAGAAELARAAAAADREAVDLSGFTALLRRRLDAAARLAVVEALWELVLADGSVAEFEDATIWRIAELLDVGPRDRMLARKKVEAKTGPALEDD